MQDHSHRFLDDLKFVLCVLVALVALGALQLVLSAA